MEVSVRIVWFCKRLQFSCQFDVSVDPVGFGVYHTKLKVSVKKQAEIYIIGIMIPFTFKKWLFAEINFMTGSDFLSLFQKHITRFFSCKELNSIRFIHQRYVFA